MDAERIVMEQQRKLRDRRAELDAMMPTPLGHLRIGTRPLLQNPTSRGGASGGGGEGFWQGGWGNGVGRYHLRHR
jgi:hypothetical protein